MLHWRSRQKRGENYVRVCSLGTTSCAFTSYKIRGYSSSMRKHLSPSTNTNTDFLTRRALDKRGRGNATVVQKTRRRKPTLFSHNIREKMEEERNFGRPRARRPHRFGIWETKNILKMKVVTIFSILSRLITRPVRARHAGRGRSEKHAKTEIGSTVVGEKIRRLLAPTNALGAAGVCRWSVCAGLCGADRPPT